MHKIYTGIGSRETPVDVLELMAKVGVRLAQHGWTLRSGHAPGADQAFERGTWLERGRSGRGSMEIYLPWDGFEGARHDGASYFSEFPPHIGAEARSVASKFHPNWEACREGARKMHTRNVYQVAGRELDLKSDMVICWTRGGQLVGGTAQALRIAKFLNIPIFNLATCTQEQILDFINHGKLP